MELQEYQECYHRIVLKLEFPDYHWLTNLIIFMRTQLLVDEVMSLKKSGARDR